METALRRAGELGLRRALVGMEGALSRTFRRAGDPAGAAPPGETLPDAPRSSEGVASVAGEWSPTEPAGATVEAAESFAAAGLGVRVCGAFGEGEPAEGMAPFVEKYEGIALGPPSFRARVEVSAGEWLDLVPAAPSPDLRPESLLSHLGEGPFLDLFSRTDLVAWLRFGRLPGLAGLLRLLLERVYPSLGPNEHRTFLFGWDGFPGGAGGAASRSLLRTLASFHTYGSVFLETGEDGLVPLARELQVRDPSGDAPGELAAGLRRELGIDLLLVHGPASHLAAGREETIELTHEGEASLSPSPLSAAATRTGFVVGRLLGLGAAESLWLAYAFAGAAAAGKAPPGFDEAVGWLQESGGGARLHTS